MDKLLVRIFERRYEQDCLSTVTYRWASRFPQATLRVAARNCFDPTRQRRWVAFQSLEPSRGAGSLGLSSLAGLGIRFLPQILSPVPGFVQLVNSVPHPIRKHIQIFKI